MQIYYRVFIAALATAEAVGLERSLLEHGFPFLWTIIAAVLSGVAIQWLFGDMLLLYAIRLPLVRRVIDPGWGLEGQWIERSEHDDGTYYGLIEFYYSISLRSYVMRGMTLDNGFNPQSKWTTQKLHFDANLHRIKTFYKSQSLTSPNVTEGYTVVTFNPPGRGPYTSAEGTFIETGDVPHFASTVMRRIAPAEIVRALGKKQAGTLEEKVNLVKFCNVRV